MRDEPIVLREKRFNFLPYRFLHRGIERRVQRIEACHDIAAGLVRGEGRVFRVLCQDQTRVDLFHDVTLNAWYLRSVRSGFSRRRTAGSAGRNMRWISI